MTVQVHVQLLFINKYSSIDTHSFTMKYMAEVTNSDFRFSVTVSIGVTSSSCKVLPSGESTHSIFPVHMQQRLPKLPDPQYVRTCSSSSRGRFSQNLLNFVCLNTFLANLFLSISRQHGYLFHIRIIIVGLIHRTRGT